MYYINTEFLFTGSATFAEKQLAFAERGPVEHTRCVSARLTFDNSCGQKRCVKITEQLQTRLE